MSIGRKLVRTRTFIWLSVVIVAMMLLLRRVRNQITYARSSHLMARIVGAITDLRQYRPPFFLPLSGIIQTVFSEYAAAPRLAYQRHDISLPELRAPRGSSCCPAVVPAGIISLDLLPHEQPRGAIMLVPGLTGSSDSGFIRRAAELCHRSGFEVWAYNPRGRGGNVVCSPFLYSAGYTEDLKRAVEFVSARRHDLPLFALGYSLGSNKLAKMLGEQGGQCKLAAAACLACPINLSATSSALRKTWGGRLLDRALVGFVQQVRLEHEEMLSQHPNIDIEAVKAAKTMADFDNEAIAPMFEYASAAEYYTNASSGPHLSGVRVPTMFIHAANDPIIPGYCIQLDEFHSNPHLLSVMTRDGGHSMDWFEGDVSRQPWGCRMGVEFFKRVLVESPKP